MWNKCWIIHILEEMKQQFLVWHRFVMSELTCRVKESATKSVKLLFRVTLIPSHRTPSSLWCHTLLANNEHLLSTCNVTHGVRTSWREWKVKNKNKPEVDIRHTLSPSHLHTRKLQHPKVDFNTCWVTVRDLGGGSFLCSDLREWPGGVGIEWVGE